MADEFQFEPRLGRSSPKTRGRGRKYLHLVLGAVAIAGGLPSGRRRSFGGARLGQGAAIGRLLAGRHRFERARRVIVKTRLVRLAGKGLGSARAHLRYIQRDGVTRDGGAGVLYSRDGDLADGRDFLSRSAGDRHQFRFIVSAEDGADYSDVRPLVSRWMAALEKDLGTRLDWVAADHLDTGHPHSHVILRGVDETGRDLVIARDYIAAGMRERLAELVTIDLGPRTDAEIERRQRLDLSAERLTPLDRQLVREQDGSGRIEAAHPDPRRHASRTARLRKLETLGLAERLGGAHWQLHPELEARLRRIGERGDIIRMMQRGLARIDRSQQLSDLVIHDRQAPVGELVGRIAGRGLSDELRDRHYLLVEATDGRTHYVDIGLDRVPGSLRDGVIVRLRAAGQGPRAADRVLATIAAANDGFYSRDMHAAHDRSASSNFIDAHLRRLEAMRRAAGAAERLSDGRWRLDRDYLERIATYETNMDRRTPVRAEVLATMPLGALRSAHAATWLDSELLAEKPTPLRDAGFGGEVRSALAARRQWLLAKGLAFETDGGLSYAADMMAKLRRTDLLRVAQTLSSELGLDFQDIGEDRIEGRLLRRLDLASGRFGVFVRSRDFSLVPWREGLERHLGRQLGLELRAGRVSWSLSRGREGPEID